MTACLDVDAKYCDYSQGGCKRANNIFNLKTHLLSSHVCEFIASYCYFSVFIFLFLCAVFQWICQFCTYANHTPSPHCEMCDLVRSDPAPSPSKPLPPSPVKDFMPKSLPVEDPDLKRQRIMREEGFRLIKLIRVCNIIRNCYNSKPCFVFVFLFFSPLSYMF